MRRRGVVVSAVVICSLAVMSLLVIDQFSLTAPPSARQEEDVRRAQHERRRQRRDDDDSAQQPPLAPVHMHSSWIANQWFPPPGYRLYNASELQDFFSQHSVLFVGDSTARRSYGTLYGILNSSTTTTDGDVSMEAVNDPQNIDMGRRIRWPIRDPPCPEQKKEMMHICRSMPSGGSSMDHHRSMDLMDLACLDELAHQLDEHPSIFHLYSIVVIVLGPWEVSEKMECTDSGRFNSTVDIVQSLFAYSNSNSNSSSQTTFVWRSWTSHADNHNQTWEFAKQHNAFVQHLIDQQEIIETHTTTMSPLSFLDFGQAMLPRLEGKARIKGDIAAHLGVEARLAFVQMLVNHLVERQRQVAMGKSWIMEQHRSRNSAPQLKTFQPGGFLTQSKPNPEDVLPPDKRDKYLKAKAEFCGDCPIKEANTKCRLRVTHMKGRYFLTQDEALFQVMTAYPLECNKTTATQ